MANNEPALTTSQSLELRRILNRMDSHRRDLTSALYSVSAAAEIGDITARAAAVKQARLLCREFLAADAKCRELIRSIRGDA